MRRAHSRATDLVVGGDAAGDSVFAVAASVIAVAASVVVVVVVVGLVMPRGEKGGALSAF